MFLGDMLVKESMTNQKQVLVDLSPYTNEHIDKSNAKHTGRPFGTLVSITLDPHIHVHGRNKRAV